MAYSLIFHGSVAFGIHFSMMHAEEHFTPIGPTLVGGVGRCFSMGMQWIELCA